MRESQNGGDTILSFLCIAWLEYIPPRKCVYSPAVGSWDVQFERMDSQRTSLILSLHLLVFNTMSCVSCILNNCEGPPSHFEPTIWTYVSTRCSYNLCWSLNCLDFWLVETSSSWSPSPSAWPWASWTASRSPVCGLPCSRFPAPGVHHFSKELRVLLMRGDIKTLFSGSGGLKSLCSWIGLCFWAFHSATKFASLRLKKKSNLGLQNFI